MKPNGYSRFYNWLVGRLYVQHGFEEHPALRRAQSILPEVPRTGVADERAIPEEHRNQRTVYVGRIGGRAVRPCPGTHGHVCCNYRTADLYIGCSLGCSYCIMKSYLNTAPLTVVPEPERIVEGIRELAASNPDRRVRVGTGEVGDSLLLDPLFDLSREIVTGVADLANVEFEMKTKTDFVDHLADVRPKGNAIIGFSLNPPELQREEEGFSATLDERIDAAHRAVAAGYRVTFHFDPIIAHSKTWWEAYRDVIGRLAGFPSERIAWVSLGTIRFTPALREEMEERPYLFDEFVPARDKKHRYLQRRRTRIYRAMEQELHRLHPELAVYLCMESAAVWKRVYGELPHSVSTVRSLFEPLREPRGQASGEARGG